MNVPNDAASPLTDTTVLDCSVTIPGPYATALLHRLGARVIKLEPPGGDVTRMFDHVHAALNAGKESALVDLKDPAGVALARAIAARADVFVEGWRPGVAERLGLGPKEIAAANPGIVYCSISGYGAEGPLAGRPGHDLNYVAESGMLRTMFGDAPPRPLGVPVADLAGGTFAALRILAALVEARTTGAGSVIDVSLAGSVRDWVEAIGGAHVEDPMSSLADLAHYGVFETADGRHLTLGVVHEDHLWRALCEVLGMQARAAMTFVERVQSPELREEIGRAIGSRTSEELERALAVADTCWAFVGSPVGESTIGGRIPGARGDVPALGEHTDAVRAEFVETALTT